MTQVVKYKMKVKVIKYFIQILVIWNNGAGKKWGARYTFWYIVLLTLCNGDRRIVQCPYLELHPSTIRIFHSAMSDWEQGSPPEFYRRQNQQANPTQQQMPTPIIRRITSIPTTPAKKPPAPPKVWHCSWLWSHWPNLHSHWPIIRTQSPPNQFSLILKSMSWLVHSRLESIQQSWVVLQSIPCSSRHRFQSL